jgi:hypothetical protein
MKRWRSPGDLLQPGVPNAFARSSAKRGTAGGEPGDVDGLGTQAPGDPSFWRPLLDLPVILRKTLGFMQTIEAVVSDHVTTVMSSSRPKVRAVEAIDSNHTAECSSMPTARPAARPPHPFFELRAHSYDMLPPCLILLDGDGPADPLVARQRRDVFPGRQCPQVGRERLSQICRKVMYRSSGDSNRCHGVISQAKGSSI